MTQESTDNGSETDRANEIAIRRIIDGRPYLIDLRRADEVIPNLAADQFLHAGPPLENRAFGIDGAAERLGARRPKCRRI